MKLLITRTMPADVVARARTRFNVTHRDLPTPMGADDLRAALRDYDAVLPTLGDLFKADVFADVPKPRAQILANFGVGYNHIDVTAARAAGLGINAGHDLNRDNLTAFVREVPGVQEVSIGHALIADALELGYSAAVRDYLRCIADAHGAT